MIRWGLACLLGGWVALSAGFVLGRKTERAGQLLGAVLDPAGTCHRCEQVVGRVSAELAAETRQRRQHQEAADYFSRVVAAQRHELDRYKAYASWLENVHAVVDEDPNLAADQAEQFLAEQDGGS